MENSVITKPYSISIDVSGDELASTDHDECFFMLIDRNGEWRINTIVKRLCQLVFQDLPVHFQIQVILS